ncbi:hypothetical protein L1987_35422 [Smallanthus sonchifolius]|uniref:Uncharacterized protein n=1 Tax=Smallanthus sonchifolius TaxID=185202 RepID=A0ACB9HZ75_9ASTR|nr:hypothetical protein L1987_35422 [Smallanthus sonchifolius]
MDVLHDEDGDVVNRHLGRIRNEAGREESDQEKSSGHLKFREDPTLGIIVVGLRCIKVNSDDKILEFGVEHINCSVTNRRKCKAREILSVITIWPEMFTKSRPSLNIFFPVEASVGWQLSPSYVDGHVDDGIATTINHERVISTLENDLKLGTMSRVNAISMDLENQHFEELMEYVRLLTTAEYYKHLGIFEAHLCNFKATYEEVADLIVKVHSPCPIAIAELTEPYENWLQVINQF